MIDLHTHSTVSDGSDPPGRIPELAAAAGCSTVALTDHDSLAGIAEAAESAKRVGINLISGCEVSCVAPKSPDGTRGSMHVLVYFVDEGEGPLQQELRELRADRLTRNAALVTRLADLGVKVDFDAIVADAGGIDGVGRPHFAKALVASGHAADITDAFDRWLGDDSPGYVPKARLTPIEIAKLAQGSGGVTVLAHPFTLGKDLKALASTVSELADAGFSGIESYYGRYSPEQRRQLVDLAARFGLVATGGSDHHGTFKPDLRVGTGQGDLSVPNSVVASLEARRPKTG